MSRGEDSERGSKIVWEGEVWERERDEEIPQEEVEECDPVPRPGDISST